MKLGIAQINCETGQIKSNMEKVSKYCVLAKEAGCSVVLFPEMVDTGYHMGIIREKASEWPGYPLNTIKKLALDTGLNILAGISEKESGQIYNTLVAVKENGEIRSEFCIVVNGRDCRSLRGLKTILKDNASVSFVKLLAGG